MRTSTSHSPLWLQVLMGFLVGMGDESPLKLRLLPVSHFANIGETCPKGPGCVTGSIFRG